MLTSNIQLRRGRGIPWRSAGYTANTAHSTNACTAMRSRAARTWSRSRRRLRRPRCSWQRYSESDETDHMDTTYWRDENSPNPPRTTRSS
eukprot:6711181-Pyramimonas_sp.AAC.1